MPYYRFMVHGRDPLVADDERGFFTSRHVFAVNQAEASLKILRRLEHEFTVGKSAQIWQSAAPLLTIEDVSQISFWKALTLANKGSVFYGLDLYTPVKAPQATNPHPRDPAPRQTRHATPTLKGLQRAMSLCPPEAHFTLKPA